MNKQRKVITEIIRFNRATKNIAPKTGKKLIGDLGEFYVLGALNRQGYKNIVHKGGQSGYDIELTNEQIKIEVKTSLLKNEGIYPEGINFYGWTVNKYRRKRPILFDYLICVALPNNLKNPDFYIFSQKEALSGKDVKIPRYTNIQKKINLFKNKRSFRKALESSPKLITSFEKKLNEKPSMYKNKWKKIK